MKPFRDDLGDDEEDKHRRKQSRTRKVAHLRGIVTVSPVSPSVVAKILMIQNPRVTVGLC